MGHKGTLFPHLQFMAQSVPPPQIVIMLGKEDDHCQGPKPECSVPQPLIFHFNYWSVLAKSSTIVLPVGPGFGLSEGRILLNDVMSLCYKVLVSRKLSFLSCLISVGRTTAAEDIVIVAVILCGLSKCVTDP